MTSSSTSTCFPEAPGGAGVWCSSSVARSATWYLPSGLGLLRAVADTLDAGDEFLLGVDLVKDVGRLIRAYDDSDGVTAEFNLNVLRVINRVLGADFPLARFEHRAVWDADNEWIEMHLVAAEPLAVTIPGASLTVRFEAGESIRTEISAKFRREGVERELNAAGLDLTEWWTDAGGDFAVALATRRG